MRLALSIVNLCMALGLLVFAVRVCLKVETDLRQLKDLEKRLTAKRVSKRV